jgi:hypothetical protein
LTGTSMTVLLWVLLKLAVAVVPARPPSHPIWAVDEVSRDRTEVQLEALMKLGGSGLKEIVLMTREGQAHHCVVCTPPFHPCTPPAGSGPVLLVARFEVE